jgi:hypothetical protein
MNLGRANFHLQLANVRSRDSHPDSMEYICNHDKIQTHLMTFVADCGVVSFQDAVAKLLLMNPDSSDQAQYDLVDYMVQKLHRLVLPFLKKHHHSWLNIHKKQPLAHYP